MIINSTSLSFSLMQSRVSHKYSWKNFPFYTFKTLAWWSGVRFLALFNVKGTAASSEWNIPALCRNAAVNADLTVSDQEAAFDRIQGADVQTHRCTDTHTVFSPWVFVAMYWCSIFNDVERAAVHVHPQCFWPQRYTGCLRITCIPFKHRQALSDTSITLIDVSLSKCLTFFLLWDN